MHQALRLGILGAAFVFVGCSDSKTSHRQHQANGETKPQTAALIGTWREVSMGSEPMLMEYRADGTCKLGVLLSDERNSPKGKKQAPRTEQQMAATYTRDGDKVTITGTEGGKPVSMVVAIKSLDQDKLVLEFEAKTLEFTRIESPKEWKIVPGEKGDQPAQKK